MGVREPKFRDFDFDRAKLIELIAYITEQSANDPGFDATKLNVALYYSDFDAYRLLGQPITGATYEKFGAGPVAREWHQVQQQLVEAGEARVEQRRQFNRFRNCLRISPERVVDHEVLSVEEREIADEVIEFFRVKTGEEASEYVRREPGWVLAGDRERIPYESAWLKAAPHAPDVELAALRFAREQLGRDL